MIIANNFATGLLIEHRYDVHFLLSALAWCLLILVLQDCLRPWKGVKFTHFQCRRGH